MLPPEIKHEAEALLSEKEGVSIKITRAEVVSGGSINYSFKIFTSNKVYFLKWNFADKFPGMFEVECKGLQLLHMSNTIAIPEVIGCKKAGIYSFLILEFVESISPRSISFERMGKEMAMLHKVTTSYFGLGHNNYIGSLSQSNTKHKDWVEFFIVERIEPQLKLAGNKSLLSKQVNKHFEKMFNVLGEIFPVEQPALLHGDLWSGNYLVGDSGKPYLIDPAVYYGHREMDIAMSKLFGGFDEAFYSTYNSELPMEKGWEKRIDICNLYPLLVHVNLFGEGYVNQVLQIIKRF